MYTRLNVPSHVVASFFQLDHSPAVVTSLPALLFGHLHQTVGLFIFRAFPSCVVLAVTQDTYFGAASTTTSILSPSGQVNTYLVRFYPFTAAFGRTVKVLCSRVLFKLLVPKSFKLIVEQTLGMFQWNMLFGAAPWGHVLRIFDREGKLAFQAGVTHAMTTSKLC
jgi:hypothetical protein